MIHEVSAIILWKEVHWTVNRNKFQHEHFGLFLRFLISRKNKMQLPIHSFMKKWIHAKMNPWFISKYLIYVSIRTIWCSFSSICSFSLQNTYKGHCLLRSKCRVACKVHQNMPWKVYYIGSANFGLLFNLVKQVFSLVFMRVVCYKAALHTERNTDSRWGDAVQDEFLKEFV